MAGEHVYYHKFHLWPPTVNKIWLRRGNGGERLSDKAVSFYDAVIAEVTKGRTGWADLPRDVMTEYLAVQIRLYPPDKRRRDADNYQKAIWDSMTKSCIWKDDSQVKHGEIDMAHVTEKGGAFEIWISPMEWHWEN